jgi:hypothetical protein
MLKKLLAEHHSCRRWLFLLLFPGLLIPVLLLAGCTGARPETKAATAAAGTGGALRLIYGGGLLGTIKPCG